MENRPTRNRARVKQQSENLHKKDTGESSSAAELNQLKRTLEEQEKRITEMHQHIDKLESYIEDQAITSHDYYQTITVLEKKLKRSDTNRFRKFARKFIRSLRKRSRKVQAFLTGGLGSEKQESLSGKSGSYQQWVETYDTLDDTSLALVQSSIEQMDSPPTISVLMPVYNPPKEYFDRALHSVRQQLYPHWELCIADDCSPDPSIRDLILEHARQDSRIKYVFRTQNGHISAASNSALEITTGSFTALVDHDDLLHPLALYRNAVEIIKHPETALLFSDEDKIDDKGRRQNPYFKSDFNYDLFLCQNMISHLGVYRTSLIKSIGGFREGLEGSQDYDLALRAIERISPEQIRHIPHVLYHWRVHTNSTADSIDSKPYARIAAKKAVKEYLERNNINAVVTDAFFAPVFNRIIYLLPQQPPEVEIVIQDDNRPERTEQALLSVLEKTHYGNYTVTLVSNVADRYKQLLLRKKLPATKLRTRAQTEQSSFSSTNNLVARASKADYLCFFSNDLEVLSSSWLQEMIGHAIRKEVGAVGIKTLSTRNTIVHGGVIMGGENLACYAHQNMQNGKSGYFARGCLQQQFSALAGGCLVMNRQKLQEAGGWNTDLLNPTSAQIDLGLKLTRKGYRNIWTPNAELLSHEIAASDSKTALTWTRTEIDYFQDTWQDYLGKDPAFNPNLDPCCENFQLAWPPENQL